MTISDALRFVLQDLLTKADHPLRAFMDNLWRVPVNSSERMTHRNSLKIRAFVRDYIRGRVSGKNFSSVKGDHDFLNHLLADEVLGKPENEELVVDEIIDFFIAAAQTTSNTICHMLVKLIQNDHLRQQMLDEIQRDAIEPYLEEEKPVGGKIDLNAAFELERLTNMEFFGRMFNEVLRVDPVAGQALMIRVMKRTERLGNVTVSKGEHVLIYNYGLHHNPEEWQRPNEFLPERWDPKSPLFYTPKGKKRHPYSYLPFSAGPRVCFGKTFADYAVRTIASILVYTVDMEFVNKNWDSCTPKFNISVNFDEDVKVRVTPRS